MRRRTVALAVAAVVLASGAALVGAPRGRPLAPNVVLVLVDALRRDHVGAYGYHLPTTPFVDSLARRGVVFDNAWAHAPQTFNSTAALLTSQVVPLVLDRTSASAPADGPAPVPMRALADENLTLAEVLRDGGYDTLALFTNPHHDAGAGFAQGFRLWRYLPPTIPGQAYATADEVTLAVGELAVQLDPERPFFAYVHYMDVHNPYLPPADVAALFVRTRGVDRYMNGRPEGPAAPSDDDLQFMIESYDAGIRHTDDAVRELIAAIDRVAHGRETIVLVTADHGDEFMDHGGLGHGHSMHQELLRVPLIASGGALPQGVHVERMSRAIDVTATVAALAEAPRPATFEGRSLLPRIAAAARGAAQDVAPERARTARVQLHADEDAFTFAWNAHLRSLTTEDFHILTDADLGGWALYDVRGDPHGQQNLFRTAPRASRRLRRKLDEFERRLTEAERRSAALGRDVGRERPIDGRSSAQLRALGYVE